MHNFTVLFELHLDPMTYLDLCREIPYLINECFVAQKTCMRSRRVFIRIDVSANLY